MAHLLIASPSCKYPEASTLLCATSCTGTLRYASPPKDWFLLWRTIRICIRWYVYWSISWANRAHNNILAQVKSLYFMDESAGVDQEEWAYVFPGLRNLYFLGITPAIPLPFAILIRCRIRLFESLGPVTRRWEAFIRSQPCIEELILNSSFVAHPPGPATLPLLRGVKGLPQDVAKVAERHSRVLDMWFTSKQALAPEDLSRLAVSASRLETIRISALNLLLLLSAAPSFVSTLQHVSLDEDETWRDFTLQKPEGLVRLISHSRTSTRLNYFYSRQLHSHEWPQRSAASLNSKESCWPVREMRQIALSACCHVPTPYVSQRRWLSIAPLRSLLSISRLRMA